MKITKLKRTIELAAFGNTMLAAVLYLL